MYRPEQLSGLFLDKESKNNSIITKIFSPFLLQSNLIELILEFLLQEPSKYANSKKYKIASSIHFTCSSPSFFKIGFLDSLLSTLHLDSARLYNRLHSLSLNLNNFLILNSFFFEKFLFSTVSIIVRSLQSVYQYNLHLISIGLSKCNLRFHQKWLLCELQNMFNLSRPNVSDNALENRSLRCMLFLETCTCTCIFPQSYMNVPICKSGKNQGQI